MIGAHMSNLMERLDNLRGLIQEPEFLEGKGLSNEVNIRIFCYDPKEEMAVRHFTEMLVTDQTLNCHIIEYNLYKVFLSILDDKRIGPGFFQRPEKLPGLVQFFLVQNGIEGYEHPGPEPVGIGTQPPDLLNRIARRLTRPEGRSCDIHGIGTAVNGCDADIRIPCRSKEFEFLHYLLRASIICLAWTPHLGSLTTFL